MADDPNKLGPLALDLLMWSRVRDLRDNALEVGRIYTKVARQKMPDVVSVNSNPQELIFGYWALAARAREDVRALFDLLFDEKPA